MRNLTDMIAEFQGWPDWDDQFEIDTVDKAVEAIKNDSEFKKHNKFSDFYETSDNRELLDYLSDMEDLDDKKYLAASLSLTGMLSTEAQGFEFVEPIKGKLSRYEDEFGDGDVSITFCYDSWKYPKELEGVGTLDRKRGYFYVNSMDIEQGTFSKRSGGKIPMIGLLWAMSTWSGTVPGYWCRDEQSKKDMMDYCGFIEFKNGNIVK